jgi:MEKHLA domain
MTNTLEYPWQQEKIIAHSQSIIQSYYYWTAKTLLDINGSPIEIAKGLFEAPFALLSHGNETDPIYNYGNQKALELMEFSWEELTQMPSRKSAENILQEDRNFLLKETLSKGFSHFTGVRISKTGKRFYIGDGILWNMFDKENKPCGQAAVYSKYKFL